VESHFVSPEELLAALVQSSDDAIYSKDTEARIRSWNPAAVRLYGYTPEEAIGKDISMIVPDDLRGEERVILARILSGEKVAHYETRRRHKSGDIVHVSLMVSPLKDHQGTIVGASVISRDVSEKRHARQLEREVEKREFVNVVAHELRNPLASIGGAAEVLLTRRDQIPDDIQLVVDIITRQTAASQRLISDLLELSRLNSGRFSIALEDVEVRWAIDEAVRSTPPPDDKNVLVIAEGGLVVRADPFRLGQVLSNLLTNAYKYGGANVSIQAEGGDCVTIEVRDDGLGLPPELEGTIFEPFVRGPQRKTTGSGLGLTITEGLVTAQGGTIGYRRGDPGSVFVVELPAVV
jgi:PAS domain S-box-containing protein